MEARLTDADREQSIRAALLALTEERIALRAELDTVPGSSPRQLAIFDRLQAMVQEQAELQEDLWLLREG